MTTTPGWKPPHLPHLAGTASGGRGSAGTGTLAGASGAGARPRATASADSDTVSTGDLMNAESQTSVILIYKMMFV